MKPRKISVSPPYAIESWMEFVSESEKNEAAIPVKPNTLVYSLYSGNCKNLTVITQRSSPELVHQDARVSFLQPSPSCCIPQVRTRFHWTEEFSLEVTAAHLPCHPGSAIAKPRVFSADGLLLVRFWLRLALSRWNNFLRVRFF